MSTAQNNADLLNRLLAVECRSLAMYLKDAHPWTHAGDEKAAAVLESMVLDQQALSARVAELIVERGGRPEPGAFPMKFTDMNLLSLDFLLTELVAYQRKVIAYLERLVQRFSADRVPRELAEEALGSERAHLEALEGLLVQPAGAS